MNREDLKKVYAYASLLWQTFKVPTEQENVLLQAQIWYDFLKPYDLETIFASMRELSKQSDFCNIGKIASGCDAIYNLVKNGINEENEIFKEIDKAITGLGSLEERFNKLSPIAKRVVGNKEKLYQYGQVETTDFNTVVESNIRRAIRTNLEQQKKIESIGEETLQNIVENKKFVQVEQKNLRKLVDKK